MVSKRVDLIISKENTTEIVKHKSGNTETNLTVSESYLGKVIRRVGEGRFPGDPDITGLSATLGAALAGVSVSVNHDKASGHTTVQVRGSAFGLGVRTSFVLDEDFNVIDRETDFGVQIIAGKQLQVYGLFSLGAAADLWLGVEFKNGRVAVDGEGNASIGLVVGEVDADASTKVNVVDFSKDEPRSDVPASRVEDPPIDAAPSPDEPADAPDETDEFSRFRSGIPIGAAEDRLPVARPEDLPEALLEDLPQALTEWFDRSGARFEPALRLDAADGPGEPADPDTTIDLLAKYGVWLTNRDGTGVFLALPRFNANHDVVGFEAAINAKGELLEIDGLEVTNRPSAGTRSRMDLVRSPSGRDGAGAPPDRGQQSPPPTSGQSRSRSGLMPGGAGKQRGTSPGTSPQPSGDGAAVPEPGAKPGAATTEPSFLLPGS